MRLVKLSTKNRKKKNNELNKNYKSKGYGRGSILKIPEESREVALL